MPNATKPIRWVKRLAKDLRPGDCDKWGYGHGTENLFRTVSRVEFIGNGIVRVWHRETISSFYDEYAETFEIMVASEPPTAERGPR